MIVQTLTNSFLRELMEGVHNFSNPGGDTFKLALYTSSADLGAGTAAYTTSGEITGTGYVAGGETLTSVSPVVSDDVVYIDFANATWNPAAFTANGALIYNSSQSNKSVAVLSFGADKTCTSTFTVQFPAPDASNAIIRLGRG